MSRKRFFGLIGGSIILIAACSGESGASSDAAVVPTDTAGVDTAIVVDSGTTDTSSADTACVPTCDGKICGAEDGCGGKCKGGTCPKGFLCSGFLPGGGPGGPTAAQCEIAGDWQITITAGSIPKDRGWDASNDPDPFVCLTVAGMRECTTAPMNSRTPSWNYKFKTHRFVSATSVDVEMLDDDGTATAPDVICPKGPVPLTRADFLAGKWSASCTTTGTPTDVVMSFEATLTAL